MTREEKTAVIEELKEKISNSPFFYVADASAMTVAQVNKLRKVLYEKGIEMRVVKNTLARKAMEDAPAEKNYAELFEALHGPTALIFTEVANVPAKIIKEYRGGEGKKPAVKAAYIDSAVYLGDDQLDALTKLKSKEDLLGELLGLLQSPMGNLLSALNGGGGQKVMGILKALEERG